MKNNKIIELKTVDSTNAFAEELLKAGKATDGTVIRAYEQSAGKGQGNNKWESEPGKNLTFSMVMFPSWLPVDQQFMLNKAITLGIMDFLELYDPGFRIKWPNDIIWRNKKMGGILINHLVYGSSLHASVIGIGLNLNQVNFNPVIPDPISLKMIISHDTDTDEAFKSLMSALDGRIIILRDKQGNHDRDYREKLIGYDEFRQYRAGDATIRGKILDVDQFGRLMLELTCGQVVSYSHGEIQYLFY
jgi:BirA family transcriptional regulator, biotin operon repressor / biotin---[acetyl-CoA-carboxylase] ligase